MASPFDKGDAIADSLATHTSVSLSLSKAVTFSTAGRR
jgi:hypothetical protein